MQSSEIRKLFLEFFQDKNHCIVESSSLIPQADPTLLFTNSGMVQFKGIFLGQEKRAYKRATTAQKCLRVGGKHNDLENVGRTARHHTFFEMLGNFSFGDYFKKEAISFAWSFITEKLGLDKERLYVTVFKDDDEAFALWQEIAGLSTDRIFRLGEKDNFWAMGETGPCGPCSEIFFDQGSHMSCGDNCGIGDCDCDRFLEIWNLVFMQFERSADGKLEKLPTPSIDTGMGLERISAICQGKFSNYDSDIFQPSIQAMAKQTGFVYGKNDEVDTALRVIADHSRAIAFLITEGVVPSNEGRGYVLKRLIRRAYRFGHLLGLKGVFLYKSAARVVEEMGEQYPELVSYAKNISEIVKTEEESFSRTLENGLSLLSDEIAKLKINKKIVLAGEIAFKLYDTFGFPLDIVKDIVEKQHLSVDEEGFAICMQRQVEQSQASWVGSGDKGTTGRFSKFLNSGLTTNFVGYDVLTAQAEIIGILNDNYELVDELDTNTGFIIATETPFYGASGGQVGDTGEIITNNCVLRVLDALRPAPNLVVHVVESKIGKIKLHDRVTLQVHDFKRLAVARNHTCTHLLHSCLRKVLGSHVKQAGSLVNSDRLRFDFTHTTALSALEIKEIEQEVNRVILSSISIHTDLTDYKTAVDTMGATALFGEKYSEEVRVVKIADESIELCGGTHLKNTAQIGSFYIVSEVGIASGVRRIEALTGHKSVSYCQEQHEELSLALNMLKAQPGELKVKLEALQEQVKKLTKQNKNFEEKLVVAKRQDLLSEIKTINKIRLLVKFIADCNMDSLCVIIDDIRSKQSADVVALASVVADKVCFVCFVDKNLHAQLTAPIIVQQIGELFGGRGGGRPDLVRAGGNKPDGIDAAFEKLQCLIKSL